MLSSIAESRHCLVRGNELDCEKAAILLMDDFRKFLNEFNEQHQGAFVEFIDYGTFFHIAI